MATNFVQKDEGILFTAPSPGVTTGTPVKIGRLLVIPNVTASTGVLFAGEVKGIFDLPKVSGEPWTEGTLVYWNTNSARATSVSGTTMQIGVAVAPAAVNPSATGRVLLNYGNFFN